VARAVFVTIVEEPHYSFPISLDALEHTAPPTREAFEDFLYPEGERQHAAAY
jgi:hypothetical protein